MANITMDLYADTHAYLNIYHNDTTYNFYSKADNQFVFYDNFILNLDKTITQPNTNLDEIFYTYDQSYNTCILSNEVSQLAVLQTNKQLYIELSDVDPIRTCSFTKCTNLYADSFYTELQKLFRKMICVESATTIVQLHNEWIFYDAVRSTYQAIYV